MTAHQAFVDASKAQWTAMVDLCFEPGALGRLAELAQTTKTSTDSILTKYRAICDAHDGGLSRIEIIDRGQASILSDHAKAKRKRSERQRIIRWRISVSLADAIQAKTKNPDQEESLQARFVRVLDIRTSEAFWEFMLSCFADLSDKELRNLGCGQEGKKRWR